MPRSSDRAAPSALLLRILAFALAALLLYLSLRGADWSRIGALLFSIRLSLLAPALAASVLAYALRGLRWRLLLTPAVPLGPAPVFFANMAGYLGNQILPARIGEVVRTVLICWRSGASRVFVLTTALAERLVDALALVLIASAALTLLPAAPAWLRQSAFPVAALGLVGLAGLAVAPRFEAHLASLASRLPWPGPRDRLRSAISSASAGLRTFHSPGRAAAFLAYTAAIWTLDAAGTMIGARALGLDLPFSVALLLLAGLGLGSSIPSTPGYVGIYQFVAVTILTPFGFTRSEALAYILLAQLMSYLVITPFGAIGLIQYRKLSPRVAVP